MVHNCMLKGGAPPAHTIATIYIINNYRLCLVTAINASSPSHPLVINHQCVSTVTRGS